MKTFITENWLTLTTLIGGIIAWFNERRKRKIDIKSAEVEHSKKIIAMYDKALKDIPSQFEARIKGLSSEIDLLRQELAEWKGKYNVLKKQFEDYKKKHQ